MELLEKSTVHLFLNGYEKGKYHLSRLQKEISLPEPPESNSGDPSSLH